MFSQTAPISISTPNHHLHPFSTEPFNFLCLELITNNIQILELKTERNVKIKPKIEKKNCQK